MTEIPKPEVFKNLKEEGVVGTNYTVLCMKDESSFLIGSTVKGLMVFNHGSQVYSKKFKSYESILDAQYIETKHCYLLCMDKDIYRKDIDNKDPYIFVFSRGRFGTYTGLSFRYSPLNDFLAAVFESDKMVVLNPRQKKFNTFLRTVTKLDQEAENPLTHEKELSIARRISDFRIIGDNQDRIATVNRAGIVSVHSVRTQFKRFSLKLPDQTNTQRHLTSYAIACCPDNKYLCVASFQQKDGDKFAVHVFEIKQIGIVLASSVTRESEWNFLGSPFCFFNSTEKVVEFLLIERKTNSLAKIEFNKQVKTINVSPGTGDSAVESEERSVSRLQKVGDSVYYAGIEGKIMKLATATA